ncbi:hypothetical protein RR11_1808 [Ruegeria sp. R11]|nr:hypothetical protein RR11_1808 [Ruegeria sp. R11]
MGRRKAWAVAHAGAWIWAEVCPARQAHDDDPNPDLQPDA